MTTAPQEQWRARAVLSAVDHAPAGSRVPEYEYGVHDMFKYTIPALAAVALMSGTAMAQSSAGTYGAGVAVAGPKGAAAAGEVKAKSDHRAHRADERRDRRDRRDREPTAQGATTTYGTGAVYTDRNRASGSAATGASATGDGRNVAGSTIDIYGETTRNGSNAEVFGDSAATSTPKRDPNRD